MQGRTIKAPQNLILDWKDANFFNEGAIYVQLSRVNEIGQLGKTAQLKSSMIKVNQNIVDYLESTQKYHDKSPWQYNEFIIINCQKDPMNNLNQIMIEFYEPKLIVLLNAGIVSIKSFSYQNYNFNLYYETTPSTILVATRKPVDKTQCYQIETIPSWCPNISMLKYDNIIFVLQQEHSKISQRKLIELLQLCYGNVIICGNWRFGCDEGVFMKPEVSTVFSTLQDNIYVSNGVVLNTPYLVPSWFSLFSFISFST